MRWYGAFNLRLILLQSSLPDYRESALSPEEAAALDARRISAQTKISELIEGYNGVCASCGGRCCQEEIDRYTPFDQHIHEALERPLETYDTRIFNPVWMVSNGVKHTIGRILDGKKKVTPCRHLSPTGCSIKKEMRPMICTSWFCPKYLRSVHPSDMRKLTHPLREIEAIHREIRRTARRT